MTPGRWVLLGATVILLIFLMLNLYYRSVQSSVWTEQKQVRAQALEVANLTKISQIDKHIWDETSWVVQGIDDQERELFVWVTAKSAQVVPASDGVSETTVHDNVAKQEPDARIIRILPGLLEDERVWEVFYSKDEPVRKYYYAFYRFEDGSFIVSYDMPSKFSDD
ncbi:hypothetical protein EBB07_19900 [Paenibacillaceae bacterium]|nr:hypothetical protein EBB07_19900 [Paenibacillaceae bacterium]